MLTFFDYLFYRFYIYCIRKKDDTAFLRSVFYVFFFSSFIIWLSY